MDELSFEVGELIDVIEYDDPEEQVSEGVGQGSVDTDLVFDVSGGGLADGSQGLHRTEGFVPCKLHQTHLELCLTQSVPDLVLPTRPATFCSIFPC